MGSTLWCLTPMPGTGFWETGAGGALAAPCEQTAPVRRPPPAFGLVTASPAPNGLGLGHPEEGRGYGRATEPLFKWMEMGVP